MFAFVAHKFDFSKLFPRIKKIISNIHMLSSPIDRERL